MKNINLTINQDAKDACYCYSGRFNQEYAEVGDNFYIRIRSTENAQKSYSETSDFVPEFGAQIYSIKEDLIRFMFGAKAGEDDVIFYPEPLWEDDGAFGAHVVLHCLSKPIVDIHELQKFVATTFAKNYSLIAGATLTIQMNDDVLDGFARSLKFGVTN